ncbi:hypothetical protein niasHT_032494 [Heterodera trifolii]|uniref:Uncharacterized protein n=1 Tax=Heterodera trifolii TaxID=157864 RepID=A0ABD2J2V7_9BILA
MSDAQKKAEEKMAKAIFISADCWLCVFDLLVPSQLGLGIALISHRFDFYVDEHFKTRKWALGNFRIWPKIGKNGTKKMEILNSIYAYDVKALPIPQVQLLRKVTGFKQIIIFYIDRNAIAFLHYFRHLFAFCPINLTINTCNYRITEFVLRNIWPMLVKNICSMRLCVGVFHSLRKFAASILNECPSLRVVSFYAKEYYFFTKFPADDSAMASDGQALAKWLFTALPNNVPKVLNCWLDNEDWNLASIVEAFKAAFASASSPANFIVVIWFCWSVADSVVPFGLTNELTREQLAFKRTEYRNCFLLIRCPIARDESKWTKWEEEAIGWQIRRDQWNQIDIRIYNEGEIGDG